MHVVMAGKPADVAVESGTYVIQFVHYGDQLLSKRLFEKPGKVERQNVEHFEIAGIPALDGPQFAAAASYKLSPFEPQRRQLGLQAVRDAAAGLGKRDGHLLHADVLEFAQPLRNVFAEPFHREREVERVGPSHTA